LTAYGVKAQELLFDQGSRQGRKHNRAIVIDPQTNHVAGLSDDLKAVTGGELRADVGGLCASSHQHGLHSKHQWMADQTIASHYSSH